jgi:hypothetical protein
MTKLAFNYDSPENNAKVRIARAKLSAHIGGHLEERKQRALYREGYAVALAFEAETRTVPVNGKPRSALWFALATLPAALDQFTKPRTYQNEKLQPFVDGLSDGADDRSEDTCKACRMARELHDYMAFRAAREGVGHELTVGFYHSAIYGPDGDAHPSDVSLFGVSFDIDKGVILADAQNPEALEVWLDTCRCCGKSIKASYHDHEAEQAAA